MATDKNMQLQMVINEMSSYGVTPETIAERMKALEAQILKELNSGSKLEKIS